MTTVSRSSLSPSRRTVLAGSAAASVASVLPAGIVAANANDAESGPSVSKRETRISTTCVSELEVRAGRRPRRWPTTLQGCASIRPGSWRAIGSPITIGVGARAS